MDIFSYAQSLVRPSGSIDFIPASAGYKSKIYRPLDARRKSAAQSRNGAEYTKRELIVGLAPEAYQFRLTATELASLRTVIQGGGPKRAGGKLGLSPHTVADHLKAIGGKTGTRTQIALARRFAVPPPESAGWLNEVTPREREILKHLVEGKTDVQIGKILSLSKNSVADHLKAVRRKVRLSSRVEFTAAFGRLLSPLPPGPAIPRQPACQP